MLDGDRVTPDGLFEPAIMELKRTDAWDLAQLSLRTSYNTAKILPCFEVDAIPNCALNSHIENGI